ncbi:MAG: aldo/keto reductase, partial [Chloroflexi bacterium]|nr:aldo/keto reductase [Chloroflexota bacterium]
MLIRKLGRSGIEVSAVGMGCWAIGGPFWNGDTPVGWGEIDDAESIRAIHHALELGATFFDTADVYGAGHSERVLGQAFADRRDQVVIATKFGNIFDEDRKRITGTSADPDHIRAACEASLRRLNTDYIDLYQFHTNGYPAEDAEPVRETLEALVQAGKIRAYAWSTDFVDRATVFAEGENCTAVQHEQNVLADNRAMIAFVEAHNLASINRGPLAMGLLTGKYTQDSTLPKNDVRGEDAPEWMQFFKDGKPNPAFLQKMEAVREVLTSEGRTLAQGALAWLWGRSPMTIPIPGFKTVQQVEDNCGAME